jgi:hypothetical protein
MLKQLSQIETMMVETIFEKWQPGFMWSGPNDGAYDFVNRMSQSKEGSSRQPNCAWSGRTLQGALGLDLHQSQSEACQIRWQQMKTAQTSHMFLCNGRCQVLVQMYYTRKQSDQIRN